LQASDRLGRQRSSRPLLIDPDCVPIDVGARVGSAREAVIRQPVPEAADESGDLWIIRQR
jgi:hypothetical protein